MKNKKDEYTISIRQTIVLLLSTALLYSLYIISLGTIVQDIRRVDISNGVYFYLIVITVICIAYINEKWIWTKLFMPLISFIVLCETMFGISVYREPTFYYIPEVCYSVGNHIIEAAKEADAKGEQEVYVKLPDIPGYGFSGPKWEWEYLSLTLYRHGLTRRQIRVFVEVDKNVNEQFGIPEE